MIYLKIFYKYKFIVYIDFAKIYYVHYGIIFFII